jgi:hypothetical protein
MKATYLLILVLFGKDWVMIDCLHMQCFYIDKYYVIICFACSMAIQHDNGVSMCRLPGTGFYAFMAGNLYLSVNISRLINWMHQILPHVKLFYLFLKKRIIVQIPLTSIVVLLHVNYNVDRRPPSAYRQSAIHR